MDEGFKIGSGNKATCLNAVLDLSYELKENLFFELSVQQRNYKTDKTASVNSTMITAGVRLNMFKRAYDF